MQIGGYLFICRNFTIGYTYICTCLISIVNNRYDNSWCVICTCNLQLQHNVFYNYSFILLQRDAFLKTVGMTYLATTVSYVFSFEYLHIYNLHQPHLKSFHRTTSSFIHVLLIINLSIIQIIIQTNTQLTIYTI